MPEPRSLKKVLHQWGGMPTIFFVFTHMSHDINSQVLTAMLPLIKIGLGISYLQAGLLLSAFSITSGFSQLLGGWLSDRFDRRIVMALGLGGVGLCSIAVGLSPNYYVMLAILVIMGIFAGAYHPASILILSSQFEEARRGKVLGLHLVGGSLGFALGPVLGGLIANLINWRVAFIILGLPALVAVPLVLKRLKPKEVIDREALRPAPINETVPANPMNEQTSLRQTLRPITTVVALATLTQIIAGSADAFIPLYLVDKHHVSPTYAAMLLGIIRTGGIAGSLLGGWLSDKWGGRNATFLTLIVTGPILYLVTRLPFSPLLIITFVLLGIFMQMRQATIQPLLMTSVPAKLRGTVFGLYFGMGMEGRSLGQPVAGHYMDIYSITDVFQAIALASVALSAGALLLLKKPKQPQGVSLSKPRNS